MDNRPRTSTTCCLLFAAMLLAQFGCSSSPNTATNQPVASPTPTASTATAVAPASPTPTAGTTSTVAPTPASGAAGSAPAKAPDAGSTSAGSSAAAPVAEKPAPPRVFTLPAGRVISVYTASDLSTKNDRGGQKFTASLAKAITDGDWVIAKRGAPVEGVIVSADPGGRVKGVASMTVRLDSLTLADGRKVDLATSSYTKQAKSTKKKDAAKIGIGAGIGAAIGAIAGGGKGAAIGAGAGGAGGTGVVLATRGQAAVIPSESQLTFRLTAPVRITKR
jgi:hypothetical protein